MRERARHGLRTTTLVLVGLSGCAEPAPVPDLGEPPRSPASSNGTINLQSNTDGQELATSCAAPVTAPMRQADLVSPLVLSPSQVQVSGAIWAGSTQLTSTSPQVTLTRTGATPPWYAIGLRAQNGVGSIAPGGPANHLQKQPLLLEIVAKKAGAVKGTLRFWTYQGLLPAPGSLKFDGIGVPEGYGTAGTTEVTPAYLGIALATGTFDTVSIKVLNPPPGALEWSLSALAVSFSPANKTCWRADPGWRLITNPNEFEPGQAPPFTHLLRTESHATHAGHTAGRYWEFNVYNDPAMGPASGSALQGSGASGNLTSPAVALRDVPEMCDKIGQGDLLGMLHWSHFHFQGYHETDDSGYAESGEPFDFQKYCGPGVGPNPYSRFCAAFACCAAETPIDPDATLPEVFADLGHAACGATCIQTMQIEKDACFGSPVDAPGGATARDRRLSYYSLDNGRTWRRVNHMNNRYHNGYPGEWHYNHAHPFQDSDGMLGTDHLGFDWDQDGQVEQSDPENPSGGQPDRQFGHLAVTQDGPMFLAPAMRFRFRFEERGTGECDTRGDGYCAGWRLDDFGLDYNEECNQPAERYLDTLGDPRTDYVGDVTPETVGQICAMLQAGLSQATCEVDEEEPACLDVVGYTHQHDQYAYDTNESAGCVDPYQSCTKDMCVESHGGSPECYPYVRQCAVPAPGGPVCCDVVTPWIEHYCAPPP